MNFYKHTKKVLKSSHKYVGDWGTTWYLGNMRACKHLGGRGKQVQDEVADMQDEVADRVQRMEDRRGGCRKRKRRKRRDH